VIADAQRYRRRPAQIFDPIGPLAGLGEQIERPTVGGEPDFDRVRPPGQAAGRR
jgi:hypothetical protein